MTQPMESVGLSPDRSAGLDVLALFGTCVIGFAGATAGRFIENAYIYFMTNQMPQDGVFRIAFAMSCVIAMVAIAAGFHGGFAALSRRTAQSASLMVVAVLLTVLLIVDRATLGRSALALKFTFTIGGIGVALMFLFVAAIIALLWLRSEEAGRKRAPPRAMAG